MEFLNLGKQPISEAQPAGNDVRFEPEVEALSGEIEKLSSPTASGGIDWKKVVELSKKVLTEQSKDLLVACYLSIGLFHTEQVPGLAQGIHALRDLLENFWETLYPPKARMRGRRNALDWWLEKTLAAVQAVEYKSGLQEAIGAINEDLSAIDQFLARNMTEAPGLDRLLEKAASLQVRAAEPVEGAPEPVSRPAPEPKSAAAVSPAKEPTEGMQTDADVQRALRGGLAKLKQVADYYMDHDLFHPLTYRLNRIAAWTPVEGPPPQIDGKTRIQPPPPHVTTALETLYQGGDWQGLLKTAESRVGEFLFWLDLSRFTAQSLDHLGKEALRDLVCRETALFVSQLKGLETLCFSDGKPFADADTQEWLKGISTASASETPVGIVQGPGNSTDDIQSMVAEVYKKARALIKAKKVGDAVSLLYQRMCDSTSGKEKLLWRLALSRLLVSAKAERTALPHLMEILQDIDRYHLEQWNPDLALQAMVEVYAGFRSQKGEEFKSRVTETLDRIAGLNPAQALRLK